MSETELKTDSTLLCTFHAPTLSYGLSVSCLLETVVKAQKNVNRARSFFQASAAQL